MATVRLAARALADLERIFEFIAVRDPGRALMVVENLRDGIGVLTRHPLVGRRVADGLREPVIGQGAATYFARYRWHPDSSQVLVLARRHAREAGYLDELGTKAHPPLRRGRFRSSSGCRSDPPNQTG